MKVDVALLGSRPYCSPYGHCGRKATWNLKGKFSELRSCMKCGRPGLPVANSLCIRSLWTQSNVEPELNANFTEGADNVRLKGTICGQIQSSASTPYGLCERKATLNQKDVRR